jgi:hypothetical protein
MFKRLISKLFSSEAAEQAPADNSWALAEASDDGRPLVFRFRTGFPSTVKRSRFPLMIAITWRFESDSGMPSNREKASMDDLEESLSHVVESTGKAVLTVIVTGNEVREWQFYTRSQDEFMRLLNQALAGKPRFPIEISTDDDPDWEAYSKFSPETVPPP